MIIIKSMTSNVKSNPVTPVLCSVQLVMLPAITDLTAYTNAPDQSAMDACYAAAVTASPTIRNELDCAGLEYSLMTNLYNGAAGKKGNE